MRHSNKFSMKQAFCHIQLFFIGIVIFISSYSIIHYLENYLTNEETFFETSDFQSKYLKYLERLSLYIHYKESGYTVDISSLGTNSDLSDLLNDEADLASMNTNRSDQENFEFYNYCLNVQDTNFIYYVENTTNGKKYCSPQLEGKVSKKNMSEYVDSIQDNPAYFVLNTKTGKYLSNVSNKYNQLSKKDLSWVVDTLSQPTSSEMTYQDAFGGSINHYVIYTSILPDFPQTDDEFYSLYHNYKSSRTAYQISIYLLPISCVLLFVLLGLLIRMTGVREGYDGIYLNAFDRTYTEIGASVIIISLILSVLIFHYTWDIFFHQSSVAIFYYLIFAYIFVFFIADMGFFSLVRRIKSHTLLHNSILYRINRFLKLATMKFLEQQNVTFRVAIFLIFYLLIRICAVFFYSRFHSKFIYIAIVLVSYAYLTRYLLKIAIDLGTIIREAKKVSEGNFDIQLKEEEMTPPMNVLGSYINQIGDGLSVAVDERLKSERFKTELITNVSHDIKTPLTSIINYVDLIKKEPIENERIEEYLNILTSKSWRLKTLIEDLVEASKASSGTMKLNLQCINLVELMKQAHGEFDDRFHDNNLEFVLNTTKDAIWVYADGRNTYRIIENLLSNANKYALNGTRVYVDIVTDQSIAKLLIKNISKKKLNITPDELMERFVRGDVSRNTEGSGLGLSIARSLATLQHGTFELELDGDLFKSIVTFPLDTTKDFTDTPLIDTRLEDSTCNVVKVLNAPSDVLDTSSHNASNSI